MASTATYVQIDQPATELRISLSGVSYPNYGIVNATPNSAQLTAQSRAGHEGIGTGDSLSWSSSNTGVATVSNGLITPVAVGTCRITVSDTSYTDSRTVQVIA